MDSRHGILLSFSSPHTHSLSLLKEQTLPLPNSRLDRSFLLLAGLAPAAETKSPPHRRLARCCSRHPGDSSASPSLSPLPPRIFLLLRVPSAARARTHFVDLSLHISCSSPLRKASIQLTAPSSSLIPKARRGFRRQKWKAGKKKKEKKKEIETSHVNGPDNK